MAHPDTFDRAAPEAAITTRLAKVLADARQRYDQRQAIDWPQFERDAQQAAEDELRTAFVLIYLMMLDDSSRATQTAQRFAQVNSQEVAKQLRTNVQRQVQAGLTSEMIFSSRRAEVIAATEITRAISSAEIAARTDRARLDPAKRSAPPPDAPILIDDGLVAIWQTLEDERVCPICSPFNGRKADQWADQFPNGPPGHPNCRCFLIYKVAKKDDRTPALVGNG